jgi:hypothetical protein
MLTEGKYIHDYPITVEEAREPGLNVSVNESVPLGYSAKTRSLIPSAAARAVSPERAGRKEAEQSLFLVSETFLANPWWTSPGCVVPQVFSKILSPNSPYLLGCVFSGK